MLERQLNSMGRPAGVNAAAWAAEQEERLCTLADELFVPPHPVDAEELAYWALVADLERYGVGDSLDHDAGEDRYAVGGSDVDDAGGATARLGCRRRSWPPAWRTRPVGWLEPR